MKVADAIHVRLEDDARVVVTVTNPPQSLVRRLLSLARARWNRRVSRLDAQLESRSGLDRLERIMKFACSAVFVYVVLVLAWNIGWAIYDGAFAQAVR